MTLFVAIAAALTAAALLFLLPPLLRRRTTAPDARVAANAAIYREQLDELAAELQRGAIGHDEFERASREIERRIVAEHADGSPAPATHRPPLAAALALGLLLPLVVALGYWQLGEPRALNPESAQLPDRQMEELAQRLSTQLQQKPDDAEGWTLLARALASLGRYEPAAQAYSRALRLQPENRDLLVEFVKALAMAGSIQFDAGNYAGAVSYWQRILHFAPPDSEFARTVNASIAEARQLGGGASAALQGTVRLDPALEGKVSGGDTVFVLARAVDGPKMPLAVTRTTVDKLPYRFTLDDSMAMAPGATISSHPAVVVVARVSKSGNPAPQKGDIEGTSAAVAPGASGVNVVLSRIVNASIAEARQLGGISSASLQGTVSLDPALKKKVSPGDIVFVLARAVDGPKMPLAVTRTTVDKLPYRFTLDDSMAMAPGATISSHSSVVVVARVSKSGNPLPQKGDIEGATVPVAPGASDLKVLISKIVD